jgi:hypothetical protein
MAGMHDPACQILSRRVRQIISADASSLLDKDLPIIQGPRLEPHSTGPDEERRRGTDRPFAMVRGYLSIARLAFARPGHATGKGCDPSSKNL